MNLKSASSNFLLTYSILPAINGISISTRNNFWLNRNCEFILQRRCKVQTRNTPPPPRIESGLPALKQISHTKPCNVLEILKNACDLDPELVTLELKLDPDVMVTCIYI